MPRINNRIYHFFIYMSHVSEPCFPQAITSKNSSQRKKRLKYNKVDVVFYPGRNAIMRYPSINEKLAKTRDWLTYWKVPKEISDQNFFTSSFLKCYVTRIDKLAFVFYIIIKWTYMIKQLSSLFLFFCPRMRELGIRPILYN